VKENYINLCTFNFGKRNYVVMKNNSKIMYFESVNGKYVMPIISFNLYDNEGKSLTVVNQHFFMNQLINRLNIAYKKGILSSNDEFSVFLNDLKAKIENDISLKKIFKGSFMNEINEENFESNKREIIKYLDKFKFDTFVNYNNVSIFNGSLEKKSDDIVEVVDDSIDISDDAAHNNSTGADVAPVISSSVDSSDQIDNMFNFSDVNKFELQDSSDVVSSDDYFATVSDVVSDNSLNVLGNELSDSSSNLSNNIVVESDIKSPIVFDSGVVDSTVQNNEVVLDNGLSVIDSENNNSNNIVSSNSSLNSDVGIFQNASNSSIDNSSVINNQPYVDNVSFNVISNGVNDSVVEPNIQSNVSYVDEVKNRLQNPSNVGSNIINLNQEKYGSEIGVIDAPFKANENVDLNDNVISDKNSLPELENISSDVNDILDNSVTEGKKGNFKVIVFLIIFVLILLVISFFLYNYVF